jgi:putative tricarboxylic transport membrane protein
MDTLGLLADGFATALTAENILWVLVGVLVGTIVGILPGLGSITAVALLLPFTFGMSPLSGLIMLCGVYFGSQYGSSTTAILVRTPGEMGSVVTTIDGYQMALRGRAGPALSTAAIGSFLAGTVSIVALTFLAPVFARLAISFGAAEYFLLMLLALLLVATLTTGSTIKAVIAALFGLWLSTVGTDAASGVTRYTGGNLQLINGIDFIVVAIALFAIAEALRVLSHPEGHRLRPRPVGRITMSRDDWRRSSWPWTRGAVLGIVIGVLPGIGPSLASYASYILEKAVARKER